MPALSPTMTEGNIASWIKSEGDEVSSGEVIAEIETDKATMEVEAVEDGILAKIILPGGSTNVKVQEVIAVIKEEGDSDSDVEAVLNSINSTSSDIETQQSTEHEQTNDITQDANSQDRQSVGNHSETIQGRIKISPLARNIAKIDGVDVSSIETGSGPLGRIVKKDIIEAKQAMDHTKQNTAAAPNSASPLNSSPLIQNTGEQNTYSDPLPMRKIIAERLLESKQSIPHFYMSIDCDISKMLKWRNEINKRAPITNDKPYYKLSVNDIIVKSTAAAMQSMPEINVSWIDNKILSYNSVDVSVAVAVDGGIMTPIIRNANSKSMSEISNEVKELVSKAKSGKLLPHEFQGGSLSISNLGMYGVKQFNAIINPPQSSILAIGAAKKTPIVLDDGSIEARDIMNITLSCDHRVIDGAVAAQFLNKIQNYLEDPVTILV